MGTGMRENWGFLRVIAIVCSFQLVTHRNWKPPPPPELDCIVGINTLVAGPP